MATRRVLPVDGGAARFSPNSDWLVVWETEKPAHLFYLASPTQAAPIELGDATTHDTAFSPDGRFLVTVGTDGEFRLWDLRAPRVAESARTVLSFRDEETVCLSRDARMLFVTTDHSMLLLDLEAEAALGHQLIVPIDPQWHVHAARFDPDQQRVLFSGDRRVGIWSLGTDELLQRACAAAGRNLTPAELHDFLPTGDSRQPCTTKLK